MTTQLSTRSELEDEILRLESALLSARTRLKSHSSAPPISKPSPILITSPTSSQHTLLLLSDSALPLGSFAFSSGLESYLAHHTPRAPFPPFLSLSIASLASTALPYVLAAWRDSSMLEELDNDFDASTPCTVARRASVAQGRALLGVWERALRGAGITRDGTEGKRIGEAVEALGRFNQDLKKTPQGGSAELLPLNGHVAPLWGLVCRSQGLELIETAYVFLLNHAKAVLSAAVRAAALGPYAAQGLLASGWLRGLLEDAVKENWATEVENAGQCAPVLDLWVGRHELLYSRIFNS